MTRSQLTEFAATVLEWVIPLGLVAALAIGTGYLAFGPATAG
jgi:hypothetical protein